MHWSLCWAIWIPPSGAAPDGAETPEDAAGAADGVSAVRTEPEPGAMLEAAPDKGAE